MNQMPDASEQNGTAARECYIPLRRGDLVRLCAEQRPGDGRGFTEFCDILLAYLHHDYLEVLEDLKDAYAPFNPDRDTLEPSHGPNGKGPTMAERAALLCRRFDEVLLSANYIRVSHEEMVEALEQISMIPLHTQVAFSDYEEYAFYYRGFAKRKVEVRKWWLRNEVEVDSFQRVAVLLRFKNEQYFLDAAKGKKKELNFVPGKAYLFLYKDVPKQDLELLFPNVKVWMTWKDRLLFIGPLMAGLGPMIIKILPSVGLLIGALALFAIGPETAREFDFDEKKHLAVWPILVAALSSSMLLVGFAVKQFLNYKHKKLQFQKRVTDTLFFKNLVSNRGVLMTVVDSAEQELGKEMILAYFHLLTAGPQTKDELDKRVEEWLREHCDRDIDFDVSKALDRLSRIAPFSNGALVRERDGKWVAAPLEEAKRTIDESWDNIFSYNGTKVQEAASLPT